MVMLFRWENAGRCVDNQHFMAMVCWWLLEHRGYVKIQGHCVSYLLLPTTFPKTSWIKTAIVFAQCCVIWSSAQQGRSFLCCFQCLGSVGLQEPASLRGCSLMLPVGLELRWTLGLGLHSPLGLLTALQSLDSKAFYMMVIFPRMQKQKLPSFLKALGPRTGKVSLLLYLVFSGLVLPNQVCFARAQQAKMLKCRGLQRRESYSQGEQVSGLPAWRLRLRVLWDKE